MTGASARQPPTRAMKHPPLCAVEGCGRKYYAKGYCRKHWERVYRNGDVETLIADRESGISDRLDANFEVVGGCWEWSGYRNENGYGELTYRGRFILAHRASFEVHKGPIPNGLMVRHTCDNPPCINPDHLATGTGADNMRDKAERGRAARGVGNAAAKLTDSQVIEIRKLRVSGWTYRQLAERFNVGATTIGRVVKRTHWKHVLEDKHGD